MEQIIHNTPNWQYEAAACIARQYTDKESSFMEKHDKFGMTKDEMIEYMKKYTEYTEKVSLEIMPVYAKYPSLEKFFREINSEKNTSIALSLVREYGQKLSSSIKDDEIDSIISKFIPHIAGEFPASITEEDIIINNVEDVFNLIDKLSFDDADKMKILDLYRNRYEVIRKLVELLNLCVPICQKYFPIIREEFEKTVKLLNSADNVEDSINSMVGLKMNMPQKRYIYISIVCFSYVSMVTFDEELTMFIGIYIFDLANLRAKNKFNDAQIATDLKAIGDPTRLKIIHLLSKDKMYNQELAEKLKLTPATISHHINVLLSSNFISITVDTEKATKIYYVLNAEKFNSVSKIIKALADNI